MPFFRKRSEKQSNPTTPTSPASPVRSGFIKRTPSNRSQLSDDWPNGDLGGGPSTSGQRRPDTLLIPQNEGDLGKSLQLDSPLRTSSRLSKTFQEIMHDKDAIPYFIQYMESINLGHLIRFWLDAESFQAATWTRIRTRSLQSLSKSSVMRSPGSVSSNSSPGLTGEKDKDGANCADNAGIETQTNQIPPVFPVSDSEIAISKSTCTCAASTADIASAEAVICPNAHNTDTSSTAATIHQCPYHSTTAEIKPKSAECDKKQNNESEESEESVISNSKESSRIPVSSAGLENSSKNSISQSSEENPMERRLSQLMDVASSDSAKERSGSQDEKFKKSIERDAVNIYSKYISLDATKPIGISEELRNATISKMCGEGGYVEPKCFAQCQDFVVDIMEKEHYPGFMRSVYHCKHQIDVLTSGRVYLADMLYNEAAMFYFMEFMEQEGATDLLQFVIASDNFQQHLQAMEGYDGVQAQTDAMVLYDKYFSLQATVPLGFTDKTRFEVESNICREEGPLPDCFSIARNIALKSIDKNYFPQFLHSELYYKYLSELVNTIQTAQYFVRKRTDSDGSSEHSVGSQSTGNESISMKNTLLASDTRHWKKVLHRFEDDLQIDSVLLNPDSLWKRPAAGGMSLGKVDSLGRFVSEFEPEPDHEKKKSSGFFKKRKEKDKEEEAMALRVAEMIIKDVTAATQGAAVSPANTIKEGDNQLS